jgi:hypothetical protein
VGGRILHWLHSISAKKNVAESNLTQGKNTDLMQIKFIFLIRVVFLW